jgi:RNA polymerase sigma factor (sigma-70 family)
LKKLKIYSDEELVKLFIGSQNNLYFEEIYERYSDKIFRKCYSFTKDRSLSEDYMHDIFIKLLLTVASFKENSKFSTYVYSITYNHCIDSTKATKKTAEVALDDKDFEDDDPEWAETKLMEITKLNNAMSKLEATDRSILLMKYQDDMSIKEIGTALKLNESAVKMRILRSKEKVRNYYLANIIFWGVLFTKLIYLIKHK